MNILRYSVSLCVISGVLALTACSGSGAAATGTETDSPNTSAPTEASGSPLSAISTRPPVASTVAMTVASGALPRFTPPPASAIPDNPFGAEVRLGRDIFTHTQKYAKPYVGDGLTCESCHLDAGRRPGSAPLWAAYVRYPRYRSKNGKVNTFAERLQGCFRFSTNGKAPPADGKIIKALTTYSYWLATGAPTGKNLAGYGFPRIAAPPEAPDYARGQKVYETHCALCHGGDGQGQKVAGDYVFPPLWGPHSFNWGAGMSKVNTAAAFIKANMPFSRGGTLTDQEAWDVAYYLDAHERPQDPRFTGNVAATRKRYHGSKWSLYGKVVNGHLLGSDRPANQP